MSREATPGVDDASVPARGRFAPSPPREALAEGACDCHVHVLGPYSTYPLAASRSYTPQEAPLEDLERMMSTLGLSRLVLVQPSVYGDDNRCMLDAMRALRRRARGVAVISDATADADLQAMHAAGVRGVRINARTGAAPDIEALRATLVDTAARVAPLGWHVQLYLPGEYLEPLSGAFRSLPTDVVIDHLGDLDVRDARSPARAALAALIATGRCWVKISGTYRLRGGNTRAALAQLVRELLERRADRLVWASDWPHTGGGSPRQRETAAIEPLRGLDTGTLVDLLVDVVPEAAARRRILVDNPAALYGF